MKMSSTSWYGVNRSFTIKGLDSEDLIYLSIIESSTGRFIYIYLLALDIIKDECTRCRAKYVITFP